MLHHLPTPQLCDPYLPQLFLWLHTINLHLFYHMLTLTLCDVHTDHTLIKVKQVSNIYPQAEGGLLEVVNR